MKNKSLLITIIFIIGILIGLTIMYFISNNNNTKCNIKTIEDKENEIINLKDKLGEGYVYKINTNENITKSLYENTTCEINKEDKKECNSEVNYSIDIIIKEKKVYANDCEGIHCEEKIIYYYNDIELKTPEEKNTSYIDNIEVFKSNDKNVIIFYYDDGAGNPAGIIIYNEEGNVVYKNYSKIIKVEETDTNYYKDEEQNSYSNIDGYSYLFFKEYNEETKTAKDIYYNPMNNKIYISFEYKYYNSTY